MEKIESTSMNLEEKNIEKLNALGEQGWELVGFGSADTGALTNGILKRKRQFKKNQSNDYSFNYNR